jgi:hypothetical protein
VVTHTYNPSTWPTEVGGFRWWDGPRQNHETLSEIQTKEKRARGMAEVVEHEALSSHHQKIKLKDWGLV